MNRNNTTRNVKEYQEFACDCLRRVFGEINVKKEWNVAKDSRDAFTRELYTPRLDIAVGPFCIDENIEDNQDNIERTTDSKISFIETMLKYSELTVGHLNEFLANRNKKPRCFIAIEIENSGSSKHMLGNIANVSILGSIGVVVPFNYKKLALCKRIMEYVKFATRVGKVEAVFKNVLIIGKDNFLQLLESRSNERK